MKLLRYGVKGNEKPAMLDNDGNIRDLSSHLSDFSGNCLDPEFLKSLESLDLNNFPIVESPERIAACVDGVGKIVCIGLNYLDHIKETGANTPKEPIIFAKMCRPSGPNDPIMLPKNSTKTDWEAELSVVIGKQCSYVTKEEAADYIAGFCVIDDLSEREFQLEHDGQWTKGKSCTGFAPLGPYLVTPDEIPNVQNLKIWADVNDHRYQDSNTDQMLFTVNDLISYLSQFMTLYPGDVISTGTPPGVGLGVKPDPIYLKAGDVVKVGIEGLGEQKHTILAYEDR